MSEHTKPLGMVISLSGVLQRAAGVCKRSRDFRHLEFALKQLNDHIELVREDPSRIGEFLALYVKD